MHTYMVLKMYNYFVAVHSCVLSIKMYNKVPKRMVNFEDNSIKIFNFLTKINNVNNL